jgi:hypothetical protein
MARTPQKPELPTLRQITGERPRCQYCGKDLTPTTSEVEVMGHITTAPMCDELLKMATPQPSWPLPQDAIERGYRPDRVFRLRHRTTWKNEPSTKIGFWTGRYEGIGYIDMPKLFCNNFCGSRFGMAAWVVGYRMKRLIEDGT